MVPMFLDVCRSLYILVMSSGEDASFIGNERGVMGLHRPGSACTVCRHLFCIPSFHLILSPINALAELVSLYPQTFAK